MTCKARQYGDTTMCGPCGVQWDTHDPDPPKCRKLKGHGLSVKLERLDESTLPPAVDPVPAVQAIIPLELPDQVARDMGLAYDTHVGGESRVDAMRRAYRVFLDSLP